MLIFNPSTDPTCTLLWPNDIRLFIFINLAAVQFQKLYAEFMGRRRAEKSHGVFLGFSGVGDVVLDICDIKGRETGSGREDSSKKGCTR
jgi:hypothetical protein